MNIFKILSSNDGSINEPNISSFLSYLLNPNEDHGFSGLLLQELLGGFLVNNSKALEKIRFKDKIVDLSRFEIKLIPEFSVYINDAKNKRRDIDILIEIYSKSNDNPLYSICLENKITDLSIIKKENQLEEEILGLQKYYKDNEIDTEIYLLYLTPSPSKVSSSSFEKLKYKNKIHLFWDKDDNSIINKLLHLLELEKMGVIDPITDQALFLVKSFISFIRTGFKSYLEEKAEKIEKKNYGKPVIDHLNDFSSRLEKGKIYSVDEIKLMFAKYVEEVSGVPLHKATRNAHILFSIVNEKNRIHYNINREDDNRKNIFYYPDINNKKQISLFDKNKQNDIKIEYRRKE